MASFPLLPRPARARLAALAALMMVAAVLVTTRHATAAAPARGSEPPPSPIRSSTQATAQAIQARSAKPVTAQVLAFNDFHGHLEADDLTISAKTGTYKGKGYVRAGGAAYLAARIRKLAKGRDSVTVSAGDLVGASPMISGYYHDDPTVEAMNRILDVGVVGNHEFDEGTPELRRLMSHATWNELAANVVSRTTGEPIFPPYAIRTVGGVRIGFIGTVTTDTPGLVGRQGIKDVQFLDEAATVKKYAPLVRQQGADAVVVLTHSGADRRSSPISSCTGVTGPAVKLAKAVAGPVDAVISAHTHNAYVCRFTGVTLTSAASYGRLVTDLRLTVDPVAHRVTKVTATNHVVAHDIGPDRTVSAIVSRWHRKIAPIADRKVTKLRRDVGRYPTQAGESLLGDVIADAQWRAAASPKTGGSQLAIANRGFMRTDLEQGPLTYGEVYAAQPFSQRLVTMTLTGRQLDRVLEDAFCNSAAVAGDQRVPLEVSSSFHWSFDPRGTCGHKVRIADFRLRGKKMTAGGRYRVTTNDFFAAGENGFPTFAAGTNRVRGRYDRDALARYLEARPGLKLPTRNRIELR